MPAINTSIQANELSESEVLANKLIQLAKRERSSGNTSITQEKLDNLSKFVLNHKRGKTSSSTSKKELDTFPVNRSLPKTPEYPPLYQKFDIGAQKSSTKPTPTTRAKKPVKPLKKIGKRFSLKEFEKLFIDFLEGIANIIDNLHLFSNLPMFPKVLKRFLKSTNKLWILILIFLIRKTVSQLLNVIKKENKVQAELNILQKSGASKLVDYETEDFKPGQPQNIFRKYEKVLKDLKFDKMMLKLELVGNFLDLSFNLIEFYKITFPDWVMGVLNAASMCMTIYRMNKDDEYIDDDVSEDLI